MKYTHVFFDLDGTLADTLQDVVAALTHSFMDVHSEEFSYAHVKLWIGHGLEHLIKSALKSINASVSKKNISYYSEKFLHYYERYPVVHTILYPEVYAVLEELRIKLDTLSICSNKPIKMVEKILSSFNIRQFFDFVSGGDSFDVKKPDADHIYRTNPIISPNMISTCLFVGDSKTDMLAAHNVGMDSVLVEFGYMQDNTIIDMATYSIKTMKEVLLIVSGIRKLVSEVL